MEKPNIRIEYEPRYFCPICDYEYYCEEDAIQCRDDCFEMQLEQEKIEQAKLELAPLEGQIQFFDNKFSEVKYEYNKN